MIETDTGPFVQHHPLSSGSQVNLGLCFKGLYLLTLISLKTRMTFFLPRDIKGDIFKMYSSFFSDAFKLHKSEWWVILMNSFFKLILFVWNLLNLLLSPPVLLSLSLQECNLIFIGWNAVYMSWNTAPMLEKDGMGERWALMSPSECYICWYPV